jgi:hypothetical protein
MHGMHEVRRAMRPRIDLNEEVAEIDAWQPDRHLLG